MHTNTAWLKQEDNNNKYEPSWVVCGDCRGTHHQSTLGYGRAGQVSQEQEGSTGLKSFRPWGVKSSIAGFEKCFRHPYACVRDPSVRIY